MHYCRYSSTCIAAAAMLLLLLLGGQRGVDAACTRIDNQDLVEYNCEGGTIEDLKEIPENAEKIRIDNMPIKRISEDLFSRYPNLVVLTASHCQIEDIDENAFKRLQGLQQLSLDNNQLHEIKAAWFRDLPAITYLDLNYNGIEKIEGGVFKHMRDLVDLRLSGNRVDCLDVESMAQLRDLKRIFINENPNFACPNALRRFLDDRNIESETDAAWRNIVEDRINVNVPPPLPPRSQDDRRGGEGGSQEVPPSEEEMMSGENVDDGSQEPRDGQSVSITPPPRSRWSEAPNPSSSRRPYMPDVIQPSSPDQDFQFQGPYYAPNVTPQELDNYAEQARNATERGWNRTVTAISNGTHRAGEAVLRAGHELLDVTTECPNSAMRLLIQHTWIIGSLLTMSLFTKCLFSC